MAFEEHPLLKFFKIIFYSVHSFSWTRIWIYLDLFMDFGYFQLPIRRTIDHETTNIWWLVTWNGHGIQTNKVVVVVISCFIPTSANPLLFLAKWFVRIYLNINCWHIGSLEVVFRVGPRKHQKIKHIQVILLENILECFLLRIQEQDNNTWNLWKLP